MRILLYFENFYKGRDQENEHHYDINKGELLLAAGCSSFDF